MVPDQPGYVSPSTFVDLLTSPPRIKILDALLQNPDEKLTITKLHNLTNIEKEEIHTHLEILNRHNLVTESKHPTDGTAKEVFTEYKYSINTEEVTVKALQKVKTTLSTTD